MFAGHIVRVGLFSESLRLSKTWYFFFFKTYLKEKKEMSMLGEGEERRRERISTT